MERAWRARLPILFPRERPKGPRCYVLWRGLKVTKFEGSSLNIISHGQVPNDPILCAIKRTQFWWQAQFRILRRPNFVGPGLILHPWYHFPLRGRFRADFVTSYSPKARMESLDKVVDEDNIYTVNQNISISEFSFQIWRLLCALCICFSAHRAPTM